MPFKNGMNKSFDFIFSTVVSGWIPAGKSIVLYFDDMTAPSFSVLPGNNENIQLFEGLFWSTETMDCKNMHFHYKILSLQLFLSFLDFLKFFGIQEDILIRA